MTLFNDRIFEQLEQHVNHDLEVAAYGDDDVLWNVAIQCRDCAVVLHDIEPESNNPNSPPGE